MEVFFRSMATDISHNVCRTMDDTMEYMDGSAAVLGEFMLPLLGPDHEMNPEEKEIARPHARDLGLAFQLTNMLRDIGEDIDFDRQYIPVEVCQQFGVDLLQKDHTDPRFQQLMEHMLKHTEQFYASADLGIAMLPIRVRESIHAARAMYSEIHERIRALKYDIFSKRVKVSSFRKLKIASQFVPTSKLVWMALMDRFTWIMLELYYNSIPACLILYGLVLSHVVDGTECSYERFLAMYVGVPITALGAYCTSTPHLRVQTRTSAIWVLVLCVLATIWTTPWDNYLVYSNVWGYGADESRLVLGTWGYVPVAEYMFFSLETILCSLIWLTIFNQRDPLQWPPKSQLRSHWRCTGLAILVLMGGGGLLCQSEPRLEYLGLILMWVAPVLMVQWAFGAEALIAHAKCLVLSIVSSALYLSIADQWAMHHSIWAISQEHSLPLIMQDLPVEEVIFFVLTATMCNCGLTLAMVVTHTGFRFKDVIDWGHSVAALAVGQDKITAEATEEAAKASISVPLNLAVLSVLALMTGFNVEVPRSVEILFTVFTTVTIGFPHAALDPLLIYQNFTDSKTRWLQYFGLLVVASVTWVFLPQLALLLFIVMTVQHFGEGDTQSNPRSFGWAEVVARGGTFLVTIHSNHAEVVDIFTLIVGGTSEAAVSNVMAACTVMQIGYAVCTVYLLVHLSTFLHLQSAQQLLLEVAVLNFMYYAAPPLLAFMVYFNIYHSQRHLTRVMGMNTWQASSRVTVMVGMSVTLLATLILGLWYSGIQATAPFIQATTYSLLLDARPLLRPVFIVISSITVPHMVLVHEVFSKTPSSEVQVESSSNLVDKREVLSEKKGRAHRRSSSEFFVNLV